MTIIESIHDPHLFKNFLGDDLTSWEPWQTALRCLYGLGIDDEDGEKLIETCTGRSASELPETGFTSALFLCGRRSGKSRGAALIASFEALFAGHESKLSAGEIGVVAVAAPRREQASIIWRYIQAVFQSSPLLQREVVDEREAEKVIALRNGLEIRILTGDWKAVRGYTLCCVVLDELAFFGYADDSKVRNDQELIDALSPGLATTGGRLIGVSTKYAMKGFCHSEWIRQHGSNRENPRFDREWDCLVWTAPSRTMNCTLDQATIDRALRRDRAAASAEYLDCWREDVQQFLPRSLVESLVIGGRMELLPKRSIEYNGGVDLSGGRNDPAGLSICHKEGAKIFQDYAGLWKAPHQPFQVVAEMADVLRSYRIDTVSGDAYAGTWPVDEFSKHGISYIRAEKSKSDLFIDLLPIICAGRDRIEILDNPVLVSQLASLERKTRSGGKDIVDHPRGQHDDLANSLAVSVASAQRPSYTVGCIDISRFGQEDFYRREYTEDFINAVIQSQKQQSYYVSQN